MHYDSFIFTEWIGCKTAINNTAKLQNGEQQNSKKQNSDTKKQTLQICLLSMFNTKIKISLQDVKKYI